MRKNVFRIILCSVLAAVLCFGATGCLIEHNYEKDYAQVVATINPITPVTKKVDTNGDGVLDTEKTFTTEAKHIYKNQLISVYSSNASSLISGGYAADGEEAAEYILNQLIYRELLLIEADKLLFFGDKKITQADKNTVTQSVYSSLDSIINDILDDIRSDHDEPTAGDITDATESTTYPVPSVEDPEEEDPDSVEKWTPDLESVLGLNGDNDRKSLEREAARRLVNTIESYVESDILATAQEKEWFERDMQRLRKLISEYREEEIYLRLFDYDYDAAADEGGDDFNGTYIVKYLWGNTAIESVKLNKLQEYVEDAINVEDSEILSYYNTLVESQKRSYANASNYNSAMTSDTTNVVYYADSNYFYVKHILVPFSDEQTAELNAFKANKLNTSEQIKAYRNRLAQEIVGYPHVEGEDDLSRPMSLNEIFSTVTSQMSKYKYDAREAERLFDSLIYEYSTDPGSFGSLKGYALQYELPAGGSDNWVEEFATAARDMYDTLEPGQVYGTPVVTDYGVHIMYLASKTKQGVKGLSEYQTPAEYKTVYDVIKETLESNKKSGAFSTWQQERIAYYTDNEKNIERFTNRYKDIYEG